MAQGPDKVVVGTKFTVRAVQWSVQYVYTDINGVAPSALAYFIAREYGCVDCRAAAFTQ